ncbi:LamB/YcsF family protein [Bellilinea sp.]|uniref:LamB/YcsF family protein n=1 Tax=Bellilinea sp. TaxID=2838785 RepID=UPI003A101AEA
MTIDLNCDMGESFGRYTLGSDEELMPYLSSINLACGFHAGDPMVIQQTVQTAVKYNLAVGAHPGYPDLQGFGRRKIEMSPEEVEAMVLYQIGALWGFLRSARIEMTHVKPHGALYNQAAQEVRLANAIARSVRRFSKELILVGLAGSALIEAGLECGLNVANEGFVERGYQADGRLVPRGMEGAVIHDLIIAARQAIQLAMDGITVHKGEMAMNVKIDTLCIHGDSPNALEIVRAVRSALEEAGYKIQRLSG